MLLVTRDCPYLQIPIGECLNQAEPAGVGLAKRGLRERGWQSRAMDSSALQGGSLQDQAL